MDLKKFETDYEFIFRINEDIICQRYFKVNHFNRKSLRSMDLKESGDACVDWIKDHLNVETNLYMMKYVNYFTHDPSYDSDSASKGDNYYFTIQYKGRSVYQRIFTADVYPSKIRNSVDIRSLISPMINLIIESMSKPTKALTLEYAGYKLID